MLISCCRLYKTCAENFGAHANSVHDDYCMLGASPQESSLRAPPVTTPRMQHVNELWAVTNCARRHKLSALSQFQACPNSSFHRIRSRPRGKGCMQDRQTPAVAPTWSRNELTSSEATTKSQTFSKAWGRTQREKVCLRGLAFRCQVRQAASSASRPKRLRKRSTSVKSWISSSCTARLLLPAPHSGTRMTRPRSPAPTKPSRCLLAPGHQLTVLSG